MGPAGCPRCARDVTLDSGGWRCEVHGPVEPLSAAAELTPQTLAALLAVQGAPAWIPWPLPPDWAVVGLRWVGGAGAPTRAVAVGCSGPGMLGGGAELVIVAEEPGTGLGARFAGLADPDPGAALAALPYDAKVHAAGHPTPLWCVPETSADCTAYVGEAQGRWLWLLVWPESEWMVVHDDVRLVDLQDPALAYEVPTAGLSGPVLT